MKKVIGLTGSLGSGCTTIADHLAKNGFQKISISNDVLSILAKKYNVPFTTREEKQEFGNKIRKSHWAEYKENLIRSTGDCGNNVVIECFRNPVEINLFRDYYPHFYLLAVFAPFKEREIRNAEKDFDQSDSRDEGEKDSLGQQVRECVTQADVVLDNSQEWVHEDDANDFFKKVDSYLRLLDSPFRRPTSEETIMHLAYSISLQSYCIQRQVGAVITDQHYRVLSIGYNDVPRNSKPCYELYSRCYRKIKDAQNIRDVCHMDFPRKSGQLVKTLF